MNVSARIEPEALEAEIVHLRRLLAQAGTDANELLTKAGSEATRRDAEDKLQKLILEELHHRIKNTLATVGAIVSQSLRGQSDVAMARKRSKVVCLRWEGRMSFSCKPNGSARRWPTSSEERLNHTILTHPAD